MRIRHLAVTAATTVMGLALVLAPATPAAAYSGYGYDNRDPYDTGCASSQVLLETVDIVTQFGVSVGTGYLWYSRNCGTNWISVRTKYASPSGWAGGITTNTYRDTPSGQALFTWTRPWVAGAVSWSDMLYAPVECVRAVGSVDSDHGVGVGWIHQPGC
ncbi:hypothetical protein [Micromonospora sp. NBRC 101691]|uniref:hypothetical protein n=1 Tax=Micromonospora sp. NBRC 101691 TaxID=3032198 RepID=UPI0024A10104|nr:hypothetical protein [Micromonospora sp. NBRC 101691]GLY25570.1 hypothetical protein Misp04_53010 [Micromonospora sp. NBRC 101691]